MEQQNPVLDSSLVEASRQIDPRDNLASRGKRFANFLIDTVITRVIVLVIFFVLMITGLMDTNEDATDVLVELVFVIIISIAYYTLLEGLTGKTLGKLITRTKVVDADGNRPSMRTLIGRSSCRFIPFEAFSFLGSEVGWHDSITETYVVND